MLQRIIYAMTALLISLNLQAQSYEVPKDYVLKVAEDYKRYESDIIQAANWLKATPLDEQEEKRQDVSSFVMQWINGSPTVNVEITPLILNFEKQNPGMMVLYMAFCAQFVLEHQYSTDRPAKHLFALRNMVEVYKAGKGVSIKKDKNLESFIKYDADGEALKWISKYLKIKD